MNVSRPLFLAICFLGIALSAAAQDHLTIRTIVIDPGHGGKDVGCMSRDKKTYEKSLTLDIGRRLAAKLEAAYPDVKVVMTRSADQYVTLSDRARIANDAAADLFISIHINSVEKGTQANGYSVHCLGQSSKAGNDLFDKNLEVVRRENAVIILEDDYSTTYQGFDPNDPQSYIFFSLMQNAHLEQSLRFAEDLNASMSAGPIKNSRGVSQDPFWVLWRTTMPAVLFECGFITNPADLAALRSEKGRDRIADNLLQAIRAFKERYDGSASPNAAPQAPAPKGPADTAPSAPAARPSDRPSVTPTTFYGTQVLATRKSISDDDPFFLGYKPVRIQGDNLTRYFIGVSENKEEALRKNLELRHRFPDSFFVKVEGVRITRTK